MMEDLIETVRKSINETTDSSNITYLPCQLGAVRSHFVNLAKKKKDWKVKVLEDSGKYSVDFEGNLTVHVDKRDWSSFLESVLGIKQPYVSQMGSSISLDRYLKEAITEKSGEVFKRLEGAIYRSFDRFPIQPIDESIHAWENVFGVVKYQSSGVLIPYENVEKSTADMIQRISNEYIDDVGGLQQILSSFEGRTSLSRFDIFKKTPYLYGSIILSKSNHVNLVFSAMVTMDFTFGSSITTYDPDTLDALSNIRELKIAGRQAMPHGGIFSYKLITDIRDAIEVL